jgi:hypothetical protein
MAKRTLYVGTITKLDLLRAPKGHSPHISGTGAFRDRKRDKKLRRRDDRRSCDD